MRIAGRGVSPWPAASPSRSAWPGSPPPGRRRPGSCLVSETIGIHYSKFDQARISVPAGVAVTIVLRNDDPIDHEFIVGGADVHERHRTGTEPVHGSRPTEVSVPAGTTRSSTITFTTPGSYLFICHLPGHEAYGMVGTLVVRGS